jgi:hypothetical protein
MLARFVGASNMAVPKMRKVIIGGPPGDATYRASPRSCKYPYRVGRGKHPLLRRRAGIGNATAAGRLTRLDYEFTRTEVKLINMLLLFVHDPNGVLVELAFPLNP